MTDLCIVTGNLIIAKEVFTSGGAEKLLEPLRKKLKEFTPDITTGKGRKEIASFAAKFSKSKTLVDKLGKGLKDEYSVLIKPIDAERKVFRDGCDKLRDEARKPLTDWEIEQKRLEDIERAKVEMELDWDTAIAEDNLFNREREMKRKEEAQAKAEAERLAKEKAEQDEKDRFVYEAKIKAEAEDKAKKDAEEALLKEQQEKERLIQESKDREEQIKIDAENAEKKRLAYIENEKKRVERERIEALEKAEIEKKQAIEQIRLDQEEKERAEAKRIAEEKEIADIKAANMNHQRAVNNRVLKKIINYCKSEEDAKTLIQDIVKFPIDDISINY